MKRIAHWLVVLGFVAIALISACAAPGASAPVPSTEKPGAPAAPKAELTREQKLVEAAKAAGEKEVALWTFGWGLGPMEKAFEAKYPFLKLKIWVGNSVDATVLEEYKAGKHNVDVLMQPVRRLVRLREAGTLQEYDFPNTVGWPYQPGHNFWRHQEVTLRVPLYPAFPISN